MTTLHELMVQVPSNETVLAAIKPRPVPKGIPAFDQIPVQEAHVERWADKTGPQWAMYHQGSFVRRFHSRKAAETAARAVVFAGATYTRNEKGWVITGPDWTPGVLPSQDDYHRNILQLVRSGVRGGPVAMMAHDLKLISDELLRQIFSAEQAFYRQGGRGSETVAWV
jgi:hypothetical protein